VGTLSLGGPSEREVLVRLEADGGLTVLDDDLALSNGLAWSADGRRMFSVDTVARTVSVRDYDLASGAVGPRRVHLRLEEGFPDGIAMDAADHLWVAVWGGGEVRRFAPDGTLVERVATGAPHTSSVAFAGDELRTLVVTTATSELGDDQLRAHPDSGRLFTARADVPGLPVAPWRGPGGPAAPPSA
jgi:sugar lactone lactonase YvrE